MASAVISQRQGFVLCETNLLPSPLFRRLPC
jgi:hypothetical protein